MRRARNHPDDAVRDLEDLRDFMPADYDGRAFVGEAAELSAHDLRITRCDLTERLVGEKTGGPPDQGGCQLQSTTFTAGYIVDRPVDGVGYAELLQNGVHAALAEAPFDRVELRAQC